MRTLLTCFLNWEIGREQGANGTPRTLTRFPTNIFYALVVIIPLVDVCKRTAAVLLIFAGPRGGFGIPT